MIASVGNGLRSVFGMLDHVLVGTARVQPECAPTGNDLGRSAQLAMLSGVALLIMAMSSSSQPDAGRWLEGVYIVALLAALAPICARMVMPTATRFERLVLVIIATLLLYAAKLIREPLAFIDHDTILHWVTANNILSEQMLFTPNPLLPVSPLYPGIEIAVTALVNITGLSVFWAAVLVTCAARLALVLALYLIYERVSGSSLVAAIGVMIYAANSSFFIFNVSFSYESLSVSLMAVAMLGLLELGDEAGQRAATAGLIVVPLLIAISVSHHMTAYITAAIIAGAAVLHILQPVPLLTRLSVAIGAAVLILITLSWSRQIGGGVDSYLGPLLDTASAELSRMLSLSGGDDRVPFEGADGTRTPLWQKIFALVGLAMIACGLAFGLLRAMRHAGVTLRLEQMAINVATASWTMTWLRLLVLMALLWPVSVVLRLTEGGWEVGNRIAPFAFLGVGIVVAIGLASAPIHRLSHRRFAPALGIGAAILIVSTIVNASGGNVLPRRGYDVAADSESIEPAGIRAAQWAREWLGPGNRFVADRVNRILMASYGSQQVTSALYDNLEAGPHLLLSYEIGAFQLKLMKAHDVEFILTDQRLTTDTPRFGSYIDTSSDIDTGHVLPLDPEKLAKFRDLPGANCVFDNGMMQIFDLRGVTHGT